MSEEKKKVVLYSSLVAGSRMVYNDTEHIRHLLNAHKIPFEFVDVSTDETGKKQMWKDNNNVRTLPQLHVEGVFKGPWEAIENANECGELKKFLFGEN